MTAVAAFVDGQPVPVSLIDARLAALLSGPYAGRLPNLDTAEGRTLRRWVVQAVTTEAVVNHEARSRGLVADNEDLRPARLTLAEALQAGGVTAAIVAAHPLARALRHHVVPWDRASDEETFAYYSRNRDRHPEAYDEVRDRLATELGAIERDRRFAHWLDERCAELVHLEPGFEHPGDPRHPDAVHRH